MITDQIRKELVAEFQSTCRERLDRVATAWVALETDVTQGAAHAALILRELHTLKGEAKLMGFNAMSQLVHSFEDLVVVVERAGFAQGSEVGDLVLRAVDVLTRASLGDAAAPLDPELGRAIIDAATQLATPRPAERTASSGPRTGSSGSRTPSSDARTASPSEPSSTEGVPSLPQLDAPRGSPEPLERDAFVRVDSAIAQRLSDAAGEVVIAHARYRNTALALRTETDPRAVAALVERLVDELHDGVLVARALELDARTLRLVPLAPLFRTHLRAVRELARELGKRASLQISDGGVAVDREVVERLAGPLLHLLRNSVDHGLESPDARRSAGKLEIGRVTLAAERVGGEVIVIVEDDGAGIDIAAVRRRAISLGMVDDQAPFDEAAAYGILVTPGFSTRTVATETSGRGVGLDVVKRQVESLGGSIRMSSRPGKGTRFELRVPISVALARVLVIEENGQLFAIPHGAVDAVISIDPNAVDIIHARRHVAYHGTRIPMVELAAALSLPATAVAPNELRGLVISHEGQRVAFLVDAWRGDTEVVIKPLDALAASRAAIGACTLDGGALALVLSPSELVARALGDVPRIRAAARSARPIAERRVLLVEDSAITRTMIAQLLRMLDYQVAEAEDGLRALRALEEQPVDAIVTDIEMPELDGIGLITRLRADRRFAETPVIVLSTRGSAADKQRAVEAGADAYLVKTEFSETALRDVLARHVRRVER